MRRLILLATFALPSVAFAQYDAPMTGKIREEIALNQSRADQLNPIIARDTAARNETNADAGQLENEARLMRARANEFRAFAMNMHPGHHRGNLEQMARQLDEYAAHNEQLAAGQRDVSNRLNELIARMIEGRNHHLEAANRLRALLADREAY